MFKDNNKLNILIIFIIVGVIAANAKDDIFENRLLVGSFAGVNKQWHSSSLPILEGAEDCGLFKDGTSRGFHTGIEVGYAIFDDLLWATSSIFYDYRPVLLSYQNESYQVFDESIQDYASLKRRFEFDLSLKYLSVGIGIKVKPIVFLPVFVTAEFDAGNPIIESYYTVDEQILSPQSVLYPDNTKRRNISKGDFNEAGTSSGVSGGIQIEIPLRRNFYLMPEVSFRKGLNDIASFTDLRTDILRITLGVIWRPEGEEEIIRESFPLAKDTLPMLRESVPSEKEEPESDTIIAIMEEPEEKIIKEISIDSINIRETFVTQTYPLLPYIFFDSASVHQIMKQKDQSNALDSPTRELLRGGDGFFEQFDESTLPKKTLEIYYRLLDILGNRLRKTKAKLFITGFTDGTELPDEKDRLLLATKRAESVAEYLKSNWGIEESRLIVRAFNLPELPTNPDYTEGFEENRRVEITSDDSKILQPVIHSKFNEYKFEDDKININVVYKKQSECESVNFGLYSGNKDLFIKEFNTCETKVEIPLTDKLKNQLIENAFEKSLSTMLSFKRSDGSYENYTLDIGIQREIEKYEIGRLNLIVFDFDRADISVSNQNTLKLFINNNVEKNSIVRITGSTDKLGTAEYNLWLSEQRANNVYKFIKGMMPEINIVEVKGLGSNLLPYDNDLPEGRFYCRTVLIEVTTPK